MEGPRTDQARAHPVSKKSSRRRHNPVPPPWYVPRPAVLTEKYQREVDQATARLESDYRRSQKRAEAAERRARNVEARLVERSASRALQRAAESARQAAEEAWLEFRRLEALMQERPAGGERGKVRRLATVGASRTDLGPDEIRDHARPSAP